jgi:hypothetical protein
MPHRIMLLVPWNVTPLSQHNKALRTVLHLCFYLACVLVNHFAGSERLDDVVNGFRQRTKESWVKGARVWNDYQAKHSTDF